MSRSDQFTTNANQIIIDVYRRDKGKNCALIAADEIKHQHHLTFTEMDIARQATTLGVTQPRKSHLFWTPEEDEFLTQNAWMPKDRIYRLYKQIFSVPRTFSALVCRMNRLGGTRALRKTTGFTAAELSVHLHVGKRTLDSLTTAGHLKGCKNGKEWHYSKDNVRRFIAAHPDQIDISRIDKYWLIAILTYDLDTENDTDRTRPNIRSTSA